ncbi:GGDEF domain-containing protein [Hydrogenimonas sp. SS33]|uniref:GGDEF domain-containing protein n=1 Tax=Hydrogenimonas leucolamina TaxID=2954236 RepID=UPI00336C1C0E
MEPNLSSLQLAVSGGLGGLALLQSAYIFYQTRKIKQYKSRIVQLDNSLESSRKLDEVTGAWNYPFFTKAANVIIKQARRKKEAVSMLLVDIDRLERVNLRGSYKAGNALLKHVYRRISHTLSERAVIGRFGGSGFFILLAGCDERRAEDFLKDLHFEFDGDVLKIYHQQYSYTVTMTCVTMHGKQILLASMLEAVEEGLLKVKQGRRGAGVSDALGKIVKWVE